MIDETDERVAKYIADHCGTDVPFWPEGFALIKDLLQKLGLV
jgi:hypothetical protein